MPPPAPAPHRPVSAPEGCHLSASGSGLPMRAARRSSRSPCRNAGRSACSSNPRPASRARPRRRHGPAAARLIWGFHRKRRSRERAPLASTTVERAEPAPVPACQRRPPAGLQRIQLDAGLGGDVFAANGAEPARRTARRDARRGEAAAAPRRRNVRHRPGRSRASAPMQYLSMRLPAEGSREAGRGRPAPSKRVGCRISRTDRHFGHSTLEDGDAMPAALEVQRRVANRPAFRQSQCRGFRHHAHFENRRDNQPAAVKSSIGTGRLARRGVSERRRAPPTPFSPLDELMQRREHRPAELGEAVFDAGQRSGRPRATTPSRCRSCSVVSMRREMSEPAAAKRRTCKGRSASAIISPASSSGR